MGSVPDPSSTSSYRQRGSSFRAPAAGAPAAEKYIEYLSPRCADIAEALRTGSSRGVGYDVIRSLGNEYRDHCAEEDSAARRQWADQTSQDREKKNAQVQQSAMAKEESKLEQERCQELLRILVGKRKRVDTMNDGEKQDLQRFSDTYQARCGKR